MNPNYNFKKHERLCNKITIGKLFESKNTVKSGFVMVKWINLNDNIDTPCTQVLFSVSKRRIKLAVNRNRIKRQMREIYRLNKQMPLLQDNKLALAIVYLENKQLPYYKIEEHVLICLNKIVIL